jgi:hypothetical protein
VQAVLKEVNIVHPMLASDGWGAISSQVSPHHRYSGTARGQGRALPTDS